MSPSSAIRPQALRAVAVLVTALSLAAFPSVSSASAAAAEPGVHDYVACPEPYRGQGCGFETFVPRGSWIFQFRYRDNNGTIQSEIDSGTCTGAGCRAFTFAVPRIDRIPLGYDTYTSAPITPPRTFVRLPRPAGG